MVRELIEGLDNPLKRGNICLEREDTHHTFFRLKQLATMYDNSIADINLSPKPIGEGTEYDVLERKQLQRAKASITLIDALVDVVKQYSVMHGELTSEVVQYQRAIRQEGLYSPANIYRFKEDLEAISQLHTEYKKKTDKFVEEGRIATIRNAELRLENIRLQGLLDERQ